MKKLIYLLGLAMLMAVAACSGSAEKKKSDIRVLMHKCFLNLAISTSGQVKRLILGLGFISRDKLLHQNASRWAPTLL